MKVSAAVAKELVHCGREIAFLDIREAAAFGDGHPLFAVPCPYSRLEQQAVRIVPRLDAPIVLIDEDGHLSERAARRLAACGYSDVRIVERGMTGWRETGLPIYAGVNVPSKTLGEILAHGLNPDTIDAPTLATWMRDAAHFHFFDARPPEEYRRFRIDGAHCLPNGELAHRFDAVVDDETTPIVITCAGRTRGIIGAIGLRAAGIRNPVYALENGTQGWTLAGFSLDRGTNPAPFPDLDGIALDKSRQRARSLKNHGVSFVTVAEASHMLADPTHTPLLFDLRTAGERAQRPCPGAIPVLGGQLVQATDHYIGVRHARLVLIDDSGLRAALAALFLAAMGYEPHVVMLDGDDIVEKPAFPAHLPEALPDIGARNAFERTRTGNGRLFDLRSSAEYETSHLSGAVWTIRSRLEIDVPNETRLAILFGGPDVTAAAALDLAERGIDCVALGDDLAGCLEAGWRLQQSAPFSREQAVDRIWFTHDRHDGNREASLRYLAWETGLVGQLDPQERAEFHDVKLPD